MRIFICYISLIIGSVTCQINNLNLHEYIDKLETIIDSKEQNLYIPDQNCFDKQFFDSSFIEYILKTQNMKIAIISTWKEENYYAIYSKNLIQSFQQYSKYIDIHLFQLFSDSKTEQNLYWPQVKINQKFNQKNIQSIIDSAHYINNNNFDLVLFQYQIFKESKDKHIKHLLKKLKIQGYLIFHNQIDMEFHFQNDKKTNNHHTSYIMTFQTGCQQAYQLAHVENLQCEEIDQQLQYKERQLNKQFLKQQLNLNEQKIIITYSDSLIEYNLKYSTDLVSKLQMIDQSIVYIIFSIKNDQKDDIYNLQQLEIYQNESMIIQQINNKQLQYFLSIVDLVLIPVIKNDANIKEQLQQALLAGVFIVSTPNKYVLQKPLENEIITLSGNNENQINQMVSIIQLCDKQDSMQKQQQIYCFGQQSQWFYIGNEFINMFSQKLNIYIHDEQDKKIRNKYDQPEYNHKRIIFVIFVLSIIIIILARNQSQKEANDNEMRKQQKRRTFLQNQNIESSEMVEF